MNRSTVPPYHAIKAPVIWEPNDHRKIVDVGRSNARMVKFQKRCFTETLINNESNSGLKLIALMYNRSFQDHLHDESAASQFEVVFKLLYKCKEDGPY